MNNTAHTAVEFLNVTKAFGNVKAVRDVSFQILIWRVGHSAGSVWLWEDNYLAFDCWARDGYRRPDHDRRS